MNIYEKINKMKEEFSKTKLEKSGFNKFANFNYFELKDIMPTIIKLEQENKLFSVISFDNDIASLTFIDMEKPDDMIVSTIPMITDYDMAKANKVQAMGAVTTYFRRYLYVNALDIVENDTLDAMDNTETKNVSSSKNTSSNNDTEFIVTFGKHKGKSLKQISDEGNVNYIKWLSENGKDDAKKAALDFLGNDETVPF